MPCGCWGRNGGGQAQRDGLAWLQQCLVGVVVEGVQSGDGGRLPVQVSPAEGWELFAVAA